MRARDSTNKTASDSDLFDFCLLQYITPVLPGTISPYIMPTVELIEEPTKKRKIEDVVDNEEEDDCYVKEPYHKKTSNGVIEDDTSANNKGIKENGPTSDGMDVQDESIAVDASNQDGGEGGANADGVGRDMTAEGDTTEPAPSDVDQTSKAANADNEDPITPAKETEGDEDVIVVGTKTQPVSPHDPNTVSAAIADAEGTPNNTNAMTPSVNHPPTPLENGIPFPKLDEASMSGMSQSERKRYREKKRRSEITQAIDKLTKVLLKVEPANLFSQNNLVYSTNTSDLIPSRSGSGRSGGGSGQQPLNRTEIINHAVKVLEKLHRENEERKMQLMRLHTVVTDAGANGAVAAAAGGN